MDSALGKAVYLAKIAWHVKPVVVKHCRITIDVGSSKALGLAH